MLLQDELALVARQEAMLVLPHFDENDAWQLGAALRALALAQQAPVAIAITVNQQRLFFSMLPGATPANDDWLRRKHNVVQHFQQSSYAVGLACQLKGKTLAERSALPERDYASHGGSFPLRVAGVGCIGSVGVSGLAQRADHELVVEALARQYGLAEVPRLAL